MSSEDELELTPPREAPYTPPRFTIDLSQPPRDRYRALAREYRTEAQHLTGLFNELLQDAKIPSFLFPAINTIARVLLRKVHSNELTEELRGISEETNIPIYLLVSLNVILDLLMGCTSGAVITGPRNATIGDRMLHFRTLDWSMDPLRRVIVQLDFIRSDSRTPDKIFASSITYVGFVGVLTGVKPGLSMSLNFRAVHNSSSQIGNMRFYLHHTLVLLGWRSGIASILRGVLLPEEECVKQEHDGFNPGEPVDLANIYDKINSYHTTAAYLIFSNGCNAISIDKDYRTSRLRSSEVFIATTNHDEASPSTPLQTTNLTPTSPRQVSGLEDLIAESKDRLQCLTTRWTRLVSRRHKALMKQGSDLSLEELAERTFLSKQQVVQWVSKWPTTNECTHFAAVMDPIKGEVVWARCYPDAVENPRDD